MALQAERPTAGRPHRQPMSALIRTCYAALRNVLPIGKMPISTPFSWHGMESWSSSNHYTGPDQTWGRPSDNVVFGPAVPHDLRSITKSVVALLLGIGIEKGWVHDVDQPVLSLLPSYADLRTPEKDRVTLRDLLTMSAGFAWNEDLPYSDPANSEIPHG